MTRFSFPPTLIFVLTLPLGPDPAMAFWQNEPPSDSTAAEEKGDSKDLPLEASRVIPIETSEGSWISVDVSPDGETVVFELLGDLYLLPIDGGVASPLTSGMAFDSQPRFSPDGREVLYVSDHSGAENLWTIDIETKKTTQVTKGKTDRYESPEWLPDGNYVVASKGEGRFGPVKLWVGHRDGGSGRILIPEPQNLRTSGAAVTGDGRQIWYAQRTGTWQYNAMFPQYQLGMYDRETGKQYERSSRYGSAFRPTLSPNGKWLVYGTRHENQTGLRIRDLQSGEERWLAYPVQRDDQESTASRDVLPGMSFTPDSESLIASYGGRMWRIPVDGGAADEIPFTAAVDLDVGPEVRFDYPIEDTPTFAVSQIRDPALSPDGKRLAFTALDRLYVVDLPDGEPMRLTSHKDVDAQPAWSPDGEWIAYVTWSDNGGSIHKVRVGGRDSQKLTAYPALYQDLAWSPDGQRIVALRGPAQQHRDATGPVTTNAAYDIVWIQAVGGSDHLVAPANSRTSPHFTSDANRIYLFNGDNGLVSIRWDGSDEKEHVKVNGNTRPGQKEPNKPSLIKMAPTGDLAIAAINHDIYSVTVPYLGGETQTISLGNPAGAAFPAKKLTEIAGQFPSWGADGGTIHWSLGNAFFTYNLDDAKAFEDSVAAAKKDDGDSDEVLDDKSGDESGEEDVEESDESDEKDIVADGDEDDEGDEDEDDEPRYQADEIRIVIEAPRDIPEGAVLLQGARIITMKGDEVIENGDVLIINNRIAAVGAGGSLDVPDGADLIDVAGHTIVPGFIDTHAHLRPSFGIHKNVAWPYVANLAYGVTTTRDPQTGSMDVLTYGDRVTAGDVMGPRIYSTGIGIFGDYIFDPIRDLDHARDVMKRYSEYYDTKTIKMYMSGNRQQRQWIIMAAKEQGITPTTEGGLDLKYNLTMMIDGYPGQEHSMPIFPLYEDVVQLTAQTGISYTPTLLVSYGGPFGENYFFTRENPHDDPKLRRFTPHAELDAKTRRRGQGAGPGPGGWFREDEHVFKEHAKVVKRIVEAGGRVCVGSHGQLQGLGYHWELWAIQSGGLSEHDALRAATLFGAEAIGLAGDLGSIEAGKLADLVILRNNPLENIRNTNTVDLVVKNGRIYDGDSLDEVWPRQVEFEGIHQDDPPGDLKAGIRSSMRDG